MADSNPAQSDREPSSIPPSSTNRRLSGAVVLDYVWLTGAAVIAGLAAWLFRWLDFTGLEFFRFLQGKATFLEWSIDPTVGVFLAMGVAALALPIIMRLRDVYFPGSEGTGIPQAIAALHVPDGPIRRRMLSVRIAVGKSLLLSLGLFTGSTIGREGPSVHVAACAMYLVSKVRKLPDHLVQRGLILGGGGAGIAAAFNTPVAGLVFALEEIGRSFEKRNASTIVRTVLIASLVVIALLGLDYLFYGSIEKRFGFNPMHWLAIPVIAIIGGTLGGLFSRSVIWGTPRISHAFRRRPWKIGLALGMLLAALGYISNGQSYGSGYPQAKAILMYRGTDFYSVLEVPRSADASQIEAAYTRLNGLHPPLEANGVQSDTARALQTAFRALSAPEERAFYDTWHIDAQGYAWWYPLTKAGSSFVTLLSGIPGGLFDPSLSVGAGLGNVLADSFHELFDGLDAQLIIMLFMVAYFAGVVQSPITVFVIMIEMTDARFVTLPLIATSVLAYECSRRVCPTSIYEALAEQFLSRVKRLDLDSKRDSS